MVVVDIQEMKENRDVAGLLKACQRRDLDIELDAIAALNEIAPEVFTELITYAETGKQLQVTAISILGMTKEPRAIPPLAGVLRNGRDFLVRKAAARALGKMNGAAVINALGKALYDENPEVQREVVIALNHLGWQPTTAAEKKHVKEIIRRM